MRTKRLWTPTISRPRYELRNRRNLFTKAEFLRLGARAKKSGRERLDGSLSARDEQPRRTGFGAHEFLLAAATALLFGIGQSF
jgi:hypothetical protein